MPVYNFSETHYLPAAHIDGAYKATLFALTRKTNAATFKGIAAGEVLFLGASGSQRGHDDWEISHKFAASPHMVGLSVGSLTGITKGSWHHVWVRFDPHAECGVGLRRGVVRRMSRCRRRRRAAIRPVPADGQAYRDSSATIFFESCPIQARAIAQASGKRVICPATGEIHH